MSQCEMWDCSRKAQYVLTYEKGIENQLCAIHTDMAHGYETIERLQP
jgi:hypothetical protein